MRKFTLTLTSALVLLAGLAASAQASVIEMGLSTDRPPASCPDNCQAIGRVSGYQVSLKGAKSNPFRATRDGKVVAFTIRLGKPRADQSDFFNRTFGGPPQARISILQPARRGIHKLVNHSRLYRLAPYFGSTPTFAFSRPMTVKRGQVVALTVPTWVPAFSVGLGEEEVWRSSRHKGECDDLQKRVAQMHLGSNRIYGCSYRTARLRYTATFIPDPRPTTR